MVDGKKLEKQVQNKIKFCKIKAIMSLQLFQMILLELYIKTCIQKNQMI
jgi:hypothetical protein